MAREIEKTIENVGNGIKDFDFPDAPVIKKTKSYKKFKHLKANREINKRHVLSLMQSITNHPDLLAYQPILVTDSFEIIEGQHTFEACKNMKIPVYYLIRKEGTSNDAAILNDTRKSWTLKSWLHHWTKRGMSDYKELKHFLEKYPMSPSQAAAIMEGNTSGKSYRKAAFKKGRFKAENKEEAVKIAKVLNVLYEQYDKSFAFKYSFVKAFLDAYYGVNGYDTLDIDIFLTRLKKASGRLIPARDASDYLKGIERVYNFHQQKSARFS